jgi:DNA helicase II / ATP-dependent DNA helicase PcrA
MKKSIEYEKELNAAQLEAVRSMHGPHLVIAGAGSGKTRVLVYRVAYLVEQGVRPDEMILLTFTRRAAEQMLRRASQVLDDRCAKVTGGTFHSFANMILRRYAGMVGLVPSFTIMDQSDAEDTVNLVRTNLGYHKLHKRFPRKAAILDVISKSVNKGQLLEQVLEEEYPHFLEWENEIRGIRNGYVEYKKLKSLLDYDDLLVYLKQLLITRDDVRRSLSQRYRYIMVDEYQDTNKMQASIACLLACEHKNIMVVGDDSQSIYSFRGAHFKNIIDFPRMFPGTRVIKLEENYRSTQPILDLTNTVIRQARDKFEKKLFTRKQGTRLPVFVDAQDEHAQSRFVADKILELREEGVELGDVAVLFRSGWHSNDLEVELASRNIPFVKYGGNKFVEAAHIKDVMAYLRICHNPRDEVSWYRVLLLMPGIGPKSAQTIVEEVVGQAKGFSGCALCAKRADVERLFDVFRRTQGPGQLPAELIRIFLALYQPYLKDAYDDHDRRSNDLDSLARIAERYKSLESFLTDMALDPPERSIVESGYRDTDGALTLSTIHSAKGLEWHTVFLLYVCEGHIPSYLSLEHEDALEEERRLFYVAATRAKENLFMLKPHVERSPRSYFQDDGGRVFTQMSRFLDEGNILSSLVEVNSAYTADTERQETDEFAQDAKDRDSRFWDMMHEFFPEEP